MNLITDLLIQMTDLGWRFQGCELRVNRDWKEHGWVKPCRARLMTSKPDSNYRLTGWGSSAQDALVDLCGQVNQLDKELQ